jgi:hypothetical protein
VTRRNLAVAAIVAALLAILGGQRPVHDPPAAPDFGRAIDKYAAFDGQDTCVPKPQPGVVALKDLLIATYGYHVWGIVRDCAIGAQSEHKEGRALDFGFDYFDNVERTEAEELLAWLLRPDRYGHPNALVRRLGIMYVIWDDRIWKAYQASKGWQDYGPCGGRTGRSCHRDHIHFSFSRAGAAARTTWWTQSTAAKSARAEASSAGASSAM